MQAVSKVKRMNYASFQIMIRSFGFWAFQGHLRPNYWPYISEALNMSHIIYLNLYYMTHILWFMLLEACIIKGSDASSETWVTCMTSNADGKDRLTEFIGSWAFAYKINIWPSIWIWNRFLILNKCILTWWDPDLHKIIQVWFIVQRVHFWWFSFMWKVVEHHWFHFIQF